MTHFSCKKAENQAIFLAPRNFEIFVTTKSSTKYVTLLNVGGKQAIEHVTLGTKTLKLSFSAFFTGSPVHKFTYIHAYLMLCNSG